VVTFPMPLKQGGLSTSSPAKSFSTRSLALNVVIHPP
jgi:hypothetical protein